MKNVIVYADWIGLSGPLKVGLLSIESLRGKEVFSFSYDEEWLKANRFKILDPDLQFFAGPQFIQGDKQNFGLFSDSSPDRWGRVLMKRREALLAREENRPTKTLLESDFLLGINDETRMGGLRFKKSSEGPFLASLPDLEIPPITSIRTLEEASLQVESDDFFNQSDANRWLNVLIAPGSSLGGARPKANVKDTDGHLWIAKFPSKNDEWNIGAWEHLANTLAARLNITVTETNARRFSQKQHTFLSKRFDRNAAGERIHFASAMTLLNRKDGYGATDGGSYLELVELIERFGVKAEEDIRELWKRIVFSVLISNTDDHLRNHGFILTENGWRLSPVYDINPNPSGQGLSLNISDDDNSLSLELCKEVASYYRWKDCEARKFIADALKVVQGWSRSAKEFGISSAEQNLMALAFENKF